MRGAMFPGLCCRFASFHHLLQLFAGLLHLANISFHVVAALKIVHAPFVENIVVDLLLLRNCCDYLK